MRKLLLLTMTLVVIISCCASLCFAKEFPDVAKDHWAYRYIDELSNQGVINGYDDGTYKPSGTITRGEFTKLVIAACLPSDIDKSDLMSEFNHWAAPYVWVAEQYGVLEKGEFNEDNIDKPITRLEMVRLVSNADISFKESKVDTSRPEQDFMDVVDMSDEDYALLCHAVNSGLVKGYEDYTFRPENTMTRAEAATMIWRFNGGREVAQ